MGIEDLLAIVKSQAIAVDKTDFNSAWVLC